MLSFITVSVTEHKQRSLLESIRYSVGADDWELVQVDGSRFDLFTGYNHGAGQARGDVLVFLHDDVVLLGNRLVYARPLELLADPGTGFIGVVGGTEITADGYWWKREKTLWSSCRGMVGHPGGSEFRMHWNCWPVLNPAQEPV